MSDYKTEIPASLHHDEDWPYDPAEYTLAEEALKQVREPGASRPLHVSELSWLTIDGRAVRCVPPEVTRG